MPQQISDIATRAIEERVFPGCVVGVVTKRGDRTIQAFGRMRFEPDSSPVKDDTIYDVASITKSIPTASLALAFIDEGRLKLTDKLVQYVPRFKNPDRELVTIKHLLTYTVGGYALSAYKDKSPREIFDTIMSHEFIAKPGKRFTYGNVPAYLLGLVVERIGNHPLNNLAHEYFFKQLHMYRTSFSTQSFLSEEIAPTEIEEWRGEVHGFVHDESAYVLSEGGKYVGHAGLFSTVPDLLIFLEMLLREGEYNGHQYFSRKIIREMATNQIPELKAYTGLGWQLADERFMGAYAGEHTFGKTGFTGTSIVCDVGRGIAIAILSNRTYPKRPENSDAINEFRSDIADIVFESTG